MLIFFSCFSGYHDNSNFLNFHGIKVLKHILGPMLPPGGQKMKPDWSSLSSGEFKDVSIDWMLRCQNVVWLLSVGLMSVGQMSVSQMSVWKCPLAKCQLAKCQLAQMSVSQMSVGKMSVSLISDGQMWVGKCQSAKCQSENVSQPNVSWPKCQSAKLWKMYAKCSCFT